jgi:Ca2+-binding RTX toxin-like protein
MVDLNIVGTDGNDILLGDIGNDTVQGGRGSDTLDGGAGNDVLAGGIGTDSDEDRFEGSAGNDTIYGGDVGSDDNPNVDFNDINYLNSSFLSIRVEFGSTSRSGTVVKSDGSTDSFFAIDAVRGTSGADTFVGGSGAGNQRFLGYAGNDVFDGTSGVNEVDYRIEARAANLKTGLSINLTSGFVQDATGHTDTLIAIERVRGTENSDRIVGNAFNNRLRGDAGNDTIYGGRGNDNLVGGLGNDRLIGGLGNDKIYGGDGNDVLYGQLGRDVFVFDTPLGSARTDRTLNFDTIKDFNVKADLFWLDNTVFRKLGLKGTEQSPAQLNKAFFTVGTEAQDRNDYLVYNKNTGILSYDPDGSGRGAAVEFARLKKNLKLTSEDILII